MRSFPTTTRVASSASARLNGASARFPYRSSPGRLVSVRRQTGRGCRVYAFTSNCRGLKGQRLQVLGAHAARCAVTLVVIRCPGWVDDEVVHDEEHQERQDDEHDHHDHSLLAELSVVVLHDIRHMLASGPSPDD